ncbi:asparaginase [Propylenella binzhouense]|uniref:Asparaginase n=1 Tax=Propylenella binzhouense TaxID=2555902 RepID=A0A964T7J2_9HYPH|nr:asparaginase [Propylenella binzhouense]MYZ49981.1 asparaginase [Propylenella binzhouense]
MANPVLVEVTRGPLVESRHRASVAVVDAAGTVLWATGDTERPVFPRSAVKPLQALPLVESGAADAFGFDTRELALAQASHGGEPAHVAGVEAMLRAAGFDESALECGAHAPSHPASAEALACAGERPRAVHNNCSGKHAGFLALAARLGVSSNGYVEPGHAVQAAVRDAMADVLRARLGEENRGIDGCSIPSWAVPLAALASGFARFGTGAGLPPVRAAAARRLYEAATSAPFFVAGTGRFCTEVMAGLAGAALVKTGAEGVFCAAVPALGLGIALKCDDGGTRGSECVMAALLARLLPEHAAALAPRLDVPVVTRRGSRVGDIRPVPGAFASLAPPARSV